MSHRHPTIFSKMNRTFSAILIWIPVLLLAQALVFNHICLFGYAMPFVFIYALLRLPLSMSKEWLFTTAFITGLILDIFSDTLGLNALCCTVLMALRRPIIRLYIPRDEELSEKLPGIKSFGIATFLKFLLTSTLVYSALVFSIETLDNFHFWNLCGKVIASTLLTDAIILGLDSLTISKREKRL